MKTIATKLYCFDELTEEAQDGVIENIAESIRSDPDDPTLSECMDSLHAIAKGLGLRLTDWNIGPFNRNNHAEVNCDESGNRAIAMFLRCLIDHGYSRPRSFKAMEFPGVCGFTGFCFDDDLCETIWEALLDGETMSKAFDRAADRIMRICEDDLEYRTSREGILECLDTKDEIYMENGETF